MSADAELVLYVGRLVAEKGLRELVDAEKLRIRTRRSPWSRFLAWLPFTVTWKSK